MLRLSHEKMEAQSFFFRVLATPRLTLRSVMAPLVSSHSQVALLDIDICGPSIPKIMGLEGEQVIADGESDWFSLGKHVQ